MNINIYKIKPKTDSSHCWTSHHSFTSCCLENLFECFHYEIIYSLFVFLVYPYVWGVSVYLSAGCDRITTVLTDMLGTAYKQSQREFPVNFTSLMIINKLTTFQGGVVNPNAYKTTLLPVCNANFKRGRKLTSCPLLKKNIKAACTKRFTCTLNSSATTDIKQQQH